MESAAGLVRALASSALTLPAFVLVAFLIFLWLTLRRGPRTIRVICGNACLFLFLYGLLEAAAGASLVLSAARYGGPGRLGYFVPDDVLGYAARKGQRVSARKTRQGEVVYDVTYTIDADGLRRTPDYPPGPGDEAVAFFGCSCAFGEGVDDEESLPYRAGELARRASYNFGFHGYGPHQMLARIDSGQVKRIAAHDGLVAVYWTGLWHVARSAGGSGWDRHGPRYILAPDGSLRRAGHFDEGPTVLGKLKAFWRTSFVYRRFIQDRYRANERDVRLYLEIVDEARRRLAAQYARSRFVLLYWDSRPDDPYHRMTVDGLRRKQIEVFFVSDILPDFRKDPSRYEIGPHDHHPSVQAHRLLARFVAEKILPASAESP